MQACKEVQGMSNVIKKAYGEEKDPVMDYRRAMEEAARCLLCEDAPCSKGCPAGTDPGKFIRSLRFKNICGAVETIRENNPLGASCAAVCPYDKMCEKECSRTGIDKPIRIGELQRFLMEQEASEDMHYIKADPLCGKKVACVGGGPASIACARELARRGVGVTIFDAHEKLGGALTYEITPTRLPQNLLDEDIRQLLELPVTFRGGTKVGRDQLVQMKKDYDAVFCGIGLWETKKLDIPGIDLEGVRYAIPFLEETKVRGTEVQLPDHVVVIGGGDVAMDCVTTAKELGAEKAAIVYRRSIEEAPANMEEVRFVQAMGVPIYTEFAPAEVIGENGHVVGLKCKSRDGYSVMTIKAEMIVLAIGQEQQAEFAEIREGDGLFIGGDMAYGRGRTVVEAVADGKEAARKIAGYIGLD